MWNNKKNGFPLCQTYKPEPAIDDENEALLFCCNVIDAGG